MQHNQHKLKAHIRGAYGPGNLGDDVLLEICINILRNHFDEKSISIGVKKPNKLGYLNKFNCRFVPLSRPIKTDVLLYGGGGQFFEFKNKVSTQKALQKILNARRQGLSLIDIAKVAINRALKKGNTSYRKSAAICLGLGPFENSSRHEIEEKIRPFLSCDYKSVRDNTSFQIARGYAKDLKLYTDPTFLIDLWHSNHSSIKRSHSGSVGVILRKWSLNDHGNKAVSNTIEAAKKLIESGKKVTLISLYEEYDKDLIESLPDFNWMIWDPQEHSPSGFIDALARSFDILVSTRAHGVLLPAQVGIPCVVVGIEPKLYHIHQFLPNGTLYCDGQDAPTIFNTALSCLDRKEELSTRLKADVDTQNKVANRFLEDFNTWIKSTINELQ